MIDRKGLLYKNGFHNMTEQEEVGICIKGARVLEKLTQGQLANSLGITIAKLRHLEKGKEKVSVFLAKKLERLTNINYRVFLTEDQSNET